MTNDAEAMRLARELAETRAQNQGLIEELAGMARDLDQLRREQNEAQGHLDKIRQALRTPDGWATKMHACHVRQERDRLSRERDDVRAVIADHVGESMPPEVSTMQAVRSLLDEITELRQQADELGEESSALADERDALLAASRPAITADARKAAIRLVAENQLRRYDEEFDTSHLSWLDFEGSATADIDALTTARLLAPVSGSNTDTTEVPGD